MHDAQAKVNVPTSAPVLFPVPTQKLPQGVQPANLSFWARSSPSGLSVWPMVAGVAIDSGPTVLHADSWQRVTVSGLSVNGSAPVGHRSTLIQLQLLSPFSTGGTVWVDDLSLMLA